MMGRIGIPEIMILLVIGAAWIVPILVVIWIVLTLNRMRIALEDMKGSLQSIERLLQRRTG